MRKILALLCALALTCGLSACGGGQGEPYQPSYNGEAVPVEPKQVKESKTVSFQGFLALLARMEGHEHQPLERSYLVSRQQSYRDYWQRVVYYAYPKFGKELEGAGARKIKQYYKAQYKACAALDDFPWLTDSSEAADNTESVVQYRLQVYAVTQLEDYVCVKFYQEAHLGGNQMEQRSIADVFDRESGEKLSLDAVADITRHAEAINQTVADTLRAAELVHLARYDIRTAEPPAFTLSEEGLVLLFAPGELAAHSAGPLQVTVAWAKLEQ